MNKLTTPSFNGEQKKIVIALVVLIIVMLIFLVYRVAQPVQKVSNDQAQDQSLYYYGKVIEVEDQRSLKFGSKVLTFPEGWIVNTAYQNTDDSTIKCSTSNKSDCRIYELTNGTDKLYISSPVIIRYEQGPQTKDETKKLTLNGVQVDFTYEKLIVEQKTSDNESQPVTGQSTYFQIHGCSSDGYCLDSLALSLDTTTNVNQVKAFESFVGQIKVQ